MAGLRAQGITSQEKSVVDSRQTQQYLRQQISFAKSHLNQFSHSQELPAQRSALQACLLCLNLGLLIYVSNVFGTKVARLLDVSNDASKFDNFKQEELINLFSDNSWLAMFSQVIESLSYAANEWNIRDAHSSELIASTQSFDSPHWTLITEDILLDFIESATELVDRQGAFDEEY